MVFTSDNDISSEIQIQKTSILHESEIYRTLIRPVVLYEHESWTIRAEDANALGVFERRILRTIFGSVFEHGAWRRRMNHTLARERVRER